MGLSSQAQKEVDAKLVELYEAFRCGVVWGHDDEVGNMREGFKRYLTAYQFESNLVDYLTDEMWEKLK